MWHIFLQSMSFTQKTPRILQIQTKISIKFQITSLFVLHDDCNLD